MDSLRTVYGQHSFALWLFLFLLVIALAVWLLVFQLRWRRAQTQVERVLSGLNGDNTVQLLTEYLQTVRATAATVSNVKREHDSMAQLMPSVIRHVGLVRFSPFHDTGGDQSFALALLDGKRDGVVLTALHARTDSRLYAKPIQSGNSSYTLTPEEIEAMDLALDRPARVAVHA